jgi:hypothetical protein
MLGRGGGKDSHVEAAHSHESTPLSSLKDPSTFAPPPKRADYGVNPTASRPAQPATAAAPEGSARQRLQEREEAHRRAEEEANRPPPGPYRPDTTGLSTAHLPKPPAFRLPNRNRTSLHVYLRVKIPTRMNLRRPLHQRTVRPQREYHQRVCSTRAH